MTDGAVTRPAGPRPSGARAAAAALLLLALSPTRASAHETTTSGVDVALTVVAAATGLTVLVEVHMGELAAVREAVRLDADGDGRVTDAERAAWEGDLRERVRRGVPLILAGEPAEPTLDALVTQFPLGPVGLPELVLRAELKAPWPRAVLAARPAEVEAVLADALWPDAPGHRRLVVQGQPTGSVRYRIEQAPPDPARPHARPTGATIRYRF